MHVNEVVASDKYMHCLYVEMGRYGSLGTCKTEAK